MVDKFNRQLYLLFALAESRRGRTADDLLEDLHDALGVEVSLRTVYRDLTDLSLTFPIAEDIRAGKTYYTMMDKFRIDDVQFTFRELMALVLLEQLLDNLGSDLVIEAGKDLTQRFVQKLSPTQRRFLSGLGDYFRVEMPGAKSDRAELLQLFIEAARLHREIEIDYYSFFSDTVSTRIIRPYTIYFRQQYYIVAWCTHRQEIREFRLDRVQQAKQLQSTFEADPTFDYEAYSRNCWEALRGKQSHLVVLVFAPAYSRFIREYHSSRADVVKDLPDGSLEFTKSVSMLEEIVPWILSHGSAVEVVSPPLLRQKVSEAVLAHAQKLNLL